MPQDHRVHLAHDWLVGLRGGERVLDRLARLFGPTTIYTLVNDGRPLTEAIDSCQVVTSPLQHFPGAVGRLRRWYLPLMPWAVERLKVAECDLLISTSSAVMKSIRPPDGTPHLCYCHSPARYVWEQTKDYAYGSAGRLRAGGLRFFRRRLRDWDVRTASRVTQFIANSRFTAEKIARYYDRDAAVVYPPVRTEFFSPGAPGSREDWYLIAGALEPYKRADLAIEAAKRGGFRLKVVGSGSQEAALRRTAGPGIEFLGRVDDEAMRDLYRRTRALIHPQQEDFGIIAVEAQACGCPVIAFAGGGALETVLSGGTGVFFETQSVESLCDAIEHFESSGSIDPQRCRSHAESFSEDRFDREILACAHAAMPIMTA